jgi:hypothetical protein
VSETSAGALARQASCFIKGAAALLLPSNPRIKDNGTIPSCDIPPLDRPTSNGDGSIVCKFIDTLHSLAACSKSFPRHSGRR